MFNVPTSVRVYAVEAVEAQSIEREGPPGRGQPLESLGRGSHRRSKVLLLPVVVVVVVITACSRSS